MSPEQRAAAIVEELADTYDERTDLVKAEALIATAIREAEDAAYERAVRVLGLHGNPSFWEAGDYLESVFLKSQEP